MRPVDRDGVSWSVGLADGLSVCYDRDPRKSSWTVPDAVQAVDCGGLKQQCIRWGPDPPQQVALLRGMTAEFSHMPPITVPSGPDAMISPHVINQRSDWPAAEAVVTLNFPNEKFSCDVASCLRSLTVCFVVSCFSLSNNFQLFFHKGSPCNGLIFETGLIIISVILKFTFTLVLYFVLAEPEQMSVLFLIAECYSNITPNILMFANYFWSFGIRVDCKWCC